ncbi:glycosyltransferase family 4 protein, partial [Escherichia coli]
SGAQRVSLDEMQTLSQEFQQSMVCSKEGRLTEQARRFGVRTHIISSLTREISILKDFVSFFQLYKLIKKEKFDIVHTHSSKTGFLGRVAAKLAGAKKIVHTVHGFAFPSTQNKIIKSIYFLMELIASYCSSIIIVMNESDEKIAREFLLKNKKTKLFLINNAIDVDKYNKDKDKDKDKDKVFFRIVMVGRLCEQKNPLLLIEAVKDLESNIQVDIIGDGPLKVKLLEKINQYNLADKVNFLGWIDAVEEYLYQYDLFVLPSRWEGMPLAMLEAMAAKVPVLSSDIEANKYLIEKTAGVLFEDNNCEDLKHKIKDLYSNVQYRDNIASKAYQSLIKDFNLVKRTKILESLYLNN